MSSQGFSKQPPSDSSPNGLRNRSSNGTPPQTGAPSQFPKESNQSHSPSSTIFGSPVSGPQLADPFAVPSWGHLPHVKSIIKADPAMTTTFDRSDAELYALWAPAR